jgi:hypothetical protein
MLGVCYTRTIMATLGIIMAVMFIKSFKMLKVIIHCPSKDERKVTDNKKKIVSKIRDDILDMYETMHQIAEMRKIVKTISVFFHSYIPILK